MTLKDMEDLWELGRTIHEARLKLAWGAAAATREPWPEFTSAYSHNPIAYVDLALASAAAVRDRFNVTPKETTEA
jgi:hypothetical protein